MEGIVWNKPILAEYYDFKELKKYDPILIDNFTKKDFKDQIKLRKLTELILLHFFKISLTLSPTHLCPIIPGRLMYIDWLTQCIELFTNKSASILDLGTGANLIYPILGNKRNERHNWIGFESDEESFDQASKVLKGLNNDRIKLVKTEPNDQFFDFPVNNEFVFTICNPPFFDINEKNSAEFKDKISKTNLVAKDNELFYNGGEVEFIKRIINDSITLKKKILLFSSLIGKFASIQPIIDHLRDLKITNFGIFELNPNQFTALSRFVVFWNFNGNHLPSFNKFKKLKNGLGTNFVLEPTNDECIEEIFRKLNDLDYIDFVINNQQEIYSENNLTKSLLIKFPGNVWSRKYRRKKAKLEFPREEVNEFFLIKDNDKLIVFWKFGLDERIFESFCGMINNIFREFGKKLIK